MRKKVGGRKKGTRNKGYFFRKGRGWYTTEGKQMIPPRYENGEHIKDEKADEKDLKEAQARYILDRQKAAVLSANEFDHSHSFGLGRQREQAQCVAIEPTKVAVEDREQLLTEQAAFAITRGECRRTCRSA